jgi:hypothetical protein
MTSSPAELEVQESARMTDSVAGSLDRSFIHTFADRLLAVWNHHDTADLPNLVTDDVAWSDPALRAPTRGVQGVRAFMENSWRAFPNLQFEVTGPAASRTTRRSLWCHGA